MAIAEANGIYLGYTGATPLCEVAGKDLNQDEKKKKKLLGKLECSMVRGQKSSFQIRIMYKRRGQKFFSYQLTSHPIFNPNNIFRHECHAHCKDDKI